MTLNEKQRDNVRNYNACATKTGISAVHNHQMQAKRTSIFLNVVIVSLSILNCNIIKFRIYHDLRYISLVV